VACAYRVGTRGIGQAHPSRRGPPRLVLEDRCRLRCGREWSPSGGLQGRLLPDRPARLDRGPATTIGLRLAAAVSGAIRTCRPSLVCFRWRRGTHCPSSGAIRWLRRVPRALLVGPPRPVGRSCRFSTGDPPHSTSKHETRRQVSQLGPVVMASSQSGGEAAQSRSV